MSPPNNKQAARVIKRSVIKHYTRGKYRNYTGNSNFYRNTRTGETPLHVKAITRRMLMFPLTTKVPLYRGVGGAPANKVKLNKVLSNGKLVNNSIASFSYNRNTARFFAKKRGFIIVLPPGRYPAINATKFIGNKSESEVTLFPGTFYVTGRNNTGNVMVRYLQKNMS